MYCQNCGTEMKDDAKFCRKCGHPVEETQSVSKNKSGMITAFILNIIVVLSPFIKTHYFETWERTEFSSFGIYKVVSNLLSTVNKYLGILGVHIDMSSVDSDSEIGSLVNTVLGIAAFDIFMYVIGFIEFIVALVFLLSSKNNKKNEGLFWKSIISSSLAIFIGNIIIFGVIALINKVLSEIAGSIISLEINAMGSTGLYYIFAALSLILWFSAHIKYSSWKKENRSDTNKISGSTQSTAEETQNDVHLTENTAKPVQNTNPTNYEKMYQNFHLTENEPKTTEETHPKENNFSHRLNTDTVYSDEMPDSSGIKKALIIIVSVVIVILGVALLLNSLLKKDGTADDENFYVSENAKYDAVCPTCNTVILLPDNILQTRRTNCPNCGEDLDIIENIVLNVPSETNGSPQMQTIPVYTVPASQDAASVFPETDAKIDSSTQTIPVYTAPVSQDTANSVPSEIDTKPDTDTDMQTIPVYTTPASPQQTNLSQDWSLSGNIINGGHALHDGTKYYIGGSSLYSIDENGQNNILLDKQVDYMNESGDYLYFVINSDDKIYRMRKDGTDLTKLSDYQAHELTLYQNRLYFVIKSGGDSNQICSMNTDGSGFSELYYSGDEIWYMNIYQDSVYFTDLNENRNIKCMNTDGSNVRTINSSKCYDVIIINNMIYYSENKDNRYLHRMDLNGNNQTQLNSTGTRNLNYRDGCLYYRDNNYNMHRCGLDGENDSIICNNGDVTFITLAPDKIYYRQKGKDSGLKEVDVPA